MIQFILFLSSDLLQLLDDSEIGYLKRRFCHSRLEYSYFQVYILVLRKLVYCIMYLHDSLCRDLLSARNLFLMCPTEFVYNQCVTHCDFSMSYTLIIKIKYSGTNLAYLVVGSKYPCPLRGKIRVYIDK